MDLKGYKMFKSKPKISKTKTYNSNILAANKDERNNYQTAIKNKLNQLVSAPSCQEITKNHNRISRRNHRIQEKNKKQY